MEENDDDAEQHYKALLKGADAVLLMYDITRR